MSLNLENDSTPERFAVVSRVHENATRLNDYQAILNRLILAMQKGIENCYESTASGLYINISTDDQILITLPFTGKGYRDYAEVTVSSGKALNKMVQATVKLDDPLPLFIFDQGTTRWYLQRDIYPTEHHALLWLERINFGLDEFIPAWRTVTNERSKWKRMAAVKRRR